MSNPKEDVTPEPLRLGHSALGGLRAPAAYDKGSEPGRRGAQAQGPEPLQPIDPKAHEPLKPGSKIE